jgi:hypothetical protein
MSQARVLHSSENGDRWLLVREARPERVFVRHEPDLASGGRTSDLDVGEFLVRGGPGPQHAELLRLIGTLAEGF